MECPGQPLTYDTYATLPIINPLFQGFSRYQNVNKEIILSANRSIQKKSASLLAGLLFCAAIHINLKPFV